MSKTQPTSSRGFATGPSHVITTSAFPIEPAEDEETNPGVFGRALSSYLVDRLREQGEIVDGVIAEDFGWCVMLRRKPTRLWIACANRSGRTDEWIAFAVAERGFLQTLLGKPVAAAEVTRISELLGQIMRGAPGVQAYDVE